MELTDEYLKKVAEATRKNGGTASKPKTRTFLPAMDVWSFPKYPARTAILPPTVNLVDEIRRFILQNETYLNEGDCWLGTWIHPQTREFYLDIATGVADLEKARETAIKVGVEDGRRIVAIFNARRNETVFLWEGKNPANI
jgi:hypothetical protein